MKITFHAKSFEGHAGRPGQEGGSSPRGSGGSEEVSIRKSAYKDGEYWTILAGGGVATSVLPTNRMPPKGAANIVLDPIKKPRQGMGGMGQLSRDVYAGPSKVYSVGGSTVEAVEAATQAILKVHDWKEK